MSFRDPACWQTTVTFMRRVNEWCHAVRRTGVVAGAGGGVHRPAECADDGGCHGDAHECIHHARLAGRALASGFGQNFPGT